MFSNQPLFFARDQIIDRPGKHCVNPALVMPGMKQDSIQVGLMMIVNPLSERSAGSVIHATNRIGGNSDSVASISPEIQQPETLTSTG